MTPRQTWNQPEGRWIVNEGNEVESKTIIDWLKVDLTQQSARAPSRLSSTLINTPITNHTLMEHQAKVEIQDIPELDLDVAAGRRENIVAELGQLVIF